MSSPNERGLVLIAALSGRALASAARRSGYRPLVADLFNDLDTRALAAASERVPGTLANGWRPRALQEAIERLARGRAPIGLAYGSGFERRPKLLATLSGRHRLLGNSPEVVARMADPAAFAELCRSAEVPCPEIRHSAAPDRGWLRKRAGGAGGAHVRPARVGEVPKRGWYLQRRASGRPVSALFLADGRNSLVLGFSGQWVAPSPGQPFRYGGAVRPAGLPAGSQHEMTEAVARVAAAAGLAGLNSADFLLTEGGFDLLEINPRPGATLDIYSHAALFELHLEACRGRLPALAPQFPGAAAAAVVYSPGPCTLPEGFAWPDWTADRQPPGVPVPAEGPLCTVHATADSAESAQNIVRQRIEELLALAGMGRC